MNDVFQDFSIIGPSLSIPRRRQARPLQWPRPVSVVSPVPELLGQRPGRKHPGCPDGSHEKSPVEWCYICYKSIKIHQNLSKSIKIYQNLSTSIKIYQINDSSENILKIISFKKFHESPVIPIKKHLQIPLKSPGQLKHCHWSVAFAGSTGTAAPRAKGPIWSRAISSRRFANLKHILLTDLTDDTYMILCNNNKYIIYIYIYMTINYVICVICWLSIRIKACYSGF